MYNGSFYKRIEVRAGDMRFPVVLKQPTAAVNTEGGREITYPTTYNAIAAIKEVSQNRSTQETTGITDTKDFFFRWDTVRDGMNRNWLINYKGKDWTVQEVEIINELKMMIRVRAKQRS